VCHAAPCVVFMPYRRWPACFCTAWPTIEWQPSGRHALHTSAHPAHSLLHPAPHAPACAGAVAACRTAPCPALTSTPCRSGCGGWACSARCLPRPGSGAWWLWRRCAPQTQRRCAGLGWAGWRVARWMAGLFPGQVAPDCWFESWMSGVLVTGPCRRPPAQPLPARPSTAHAHLILPPACLPACLPACRK
jgi:hypothetical protein